MELKHGHTVSTALHGHLASSSSSLPIPSALIHLHQYLASAHASLFYAHRLFALNTLVLSVVVHLVCP